MELHPLQHSERRALRQLYRASFPACERLSWSELERQQKSGKMDLLTVVDEGEVRGILVMSPTKTLVLGVYLSIFPGKRNGGTGTKVLQAIRTYYEGRPICLEIEDPEEPGAPNTEQRRRRQNFYLRNGIHTIGKMYMYETDMILMATDENVTFAQYREVLCRQLGSGYVDAHLIEK